MFHSSHHEHFSSTGSRLESRVAFASKLRRVTLLIAATICVNSAFAADPPPAPRSATPFVRPTQYHLLPPIPKTEVDRVPTVDDLVPVLDDSSVLTLMSAPVRRTTVASEQSVQEEWPYTEAAYGRHGIRSVPESPERIGAFRPARVPSKYATQQAPIDQANGTEPRYASTPALFETVSSPFVNQPVEHLDSPVWDNEIQTVSHSVNVPIPDPLTSPPATLLPPGATIEMQPPYPQEADTVHSVDCQCEFCQGTGLGDPGILFGSQPTAIVSQRATTVRLDGLVWWSNSSSLPALATTSPAGTALNSAGILNNAGTTSVFDDHAFDQAAPGYRVQVDHDLEGYGGIDFEFLQLGTRSENMMASSSQYPILARPFTNITDGTEAASVIAFPATSTGAIQIGMDSRFRSAAIHYYQLAMEESSRSDDDQFVAKFQIGPRIATLQETLWTNDHSFDLANNTSIQRTDAMKVENLFVGGEVGMQLNRRFQNVDLTAGLSLAMGANRQKSQANGRSVFTDAAGQASTSDSGWLQTSVGAGEIKRNQFSVIPAAELGIGFQTRWGWKLSFGYNVMLWTNSLRVTEQLPTGLDPTFGGGAPGGVVRPFSSLINDSFLAHGVSFGIERRW